MPFVERDTVTVARDSPSGLLLTVSVETLGQILVQSLKQLYKSTLLRHGHLPELTLTDYLPSKTRREMLPPVSVLAYFLGQFSPLLSELPSVPTLALAIELSHGIDCHQGLASPLAFPSQEVLSPLGE